MQSAQVAANGQRRVGRSAAYADRCWQRMGIIRDRAAYFHAQRVSMFSVRHVYPPASASRRGAGECMSLPSLFQSRSSRRRGRRGRNRLRRRWCQRRRDRRRTCQDVRWRLPQGDVKLQLRPVVVQDRVQVIGAPCPSRRTLSRTSMGSPSPPRIRRRSSANASPAVRTAFSLVPIWDHRAWARA